MGQLYIYIEIRKTDENGQCVDNGDYQSISVPLTGTDPEDHDGQLEELTEALLRVASAS